ncbi:MAG: hypothetical protein AAF446_10155, partial [Pseudomonadota bacterium]
MKNTRREYQGRLESLRVLNQVESDDEKLQQWLQKRNLADTPSVLEQLTVKSEWQRAVETVLGDWLAARMTAQSLPSFVPNSRLALVQQRESATSPRAGRLSSVVRNAGALMAVLDRVELADSVEDAHVRLAVLDDDESVITRDGLWLGQGWVWSQGKATEADGRLARQQQVRELEQSLKQIGQDISEQQQGLDDVLLQIKQANAEHLEQRNALDALKAHRARLAGVQAGLENRFQALQRQRTAREQEQQELSERQQADQRSVSEARAELENRLATLETADQAQQAAEQGRNQHQQQRTECLHAWRAPRDRHA